MRKKLIITYYLSIATPFLIIFCVFLMGGGHGWYGPTFILFPWATFNVVWQGQLSPLLATAGALLQYPVYGLLIDKFRGTKFQYPVIAVILILHGALAVAILMNVERAF